jgi:LmbE family N-acetylglucosaminyl deacetylase
MTKPSISSVRFQTAPGVRRALLRVASASAKRLHASGPPSMWELFVAARSMASTGPLVLPPTATRALVLAPHPDDETIGCGGTAALLAGSGCSVDVVVVSDGEGSTSSGGDAARTAARRRKEALRACIHLGTRPPRFLGLVDGGVGDAIDDLADRLCSILRELRPELVFLPWPLDGHPDHQAVGRAFAAAKPDPAIDVWCYEVWTALLPNRIVDVTQTWPAKQSAIEEHRGPDDAFDLQSHLHLARWRSIFGLDGHGWAEAFLVLTPAEHARALEGPRG